MALTNVWLAGYGGPVIGATAVWLAPNDGTVPSATLVTLVGWNGAVAGATPVWIAGYGGPPPAAIGAIPICISGWGGGSGSGGGTTTSVWSAADATANGMTLSNGGLTVSSATITGGWKSIRNTTSHASGKWYFELLCNASNADGNEIYGFGSSSLNVLNYIGGSTYSGGVSWAGNNLSAGFTSNYTTTLPTAANDVWSFAIDFTSGGIWIAQNNVWKNSSNPATGSLPIISFTPATVGALFAAVSFYTAGQIWTLQPTAASQKYAPPSGFSAWDGGVAPPPTSVWSSSDATANGMTLSNGGLTVTPSLTSGVWGAIRSSTSHNSGKWYIEFASAVSPSISGASPPGEGMASVGFVPTSYLGSTNYSIGIWAANGNQASTGFTANYLASDFPVPPLAGDVYGLAIDFTSGSIWKSRNGVWSSSSNPATGTLPIGSFTPATVGALFAAMSLFGDVGNGVWTLQSTAASQKYAPPSGFTPWG